MYMYVHVCTCMYMYVHVCTCMYMYVHVALKTLPPSPSFHHLLPKVVHVHVHDMIPVTLSSSQGESISVLCVLVAEVDSR